MPFTHHPHNDYYISPQIEYGNTATVPALKSMNTNRGNEHCVRNHVFPIFLWFLIGWSPLGLSYVLVFLTFLSLAFLLEALVHNTIDAFKLLVKPLLACGEFIFFFGLWCIMFTVYGLSEMITGCHNNLYHSLPSWKDTWVTKRWPCSAPSFFISVAKNSYLATWYALGHAEMATLLQFCQKRGLHLCSWPWHWEWSHSTSWDIIRSNPYTWCTLLYNACCICNWICDTSQSDEQ